MDNQNSSMGQQHQTAQDDASSSGHSHPAPPATTTSADLNQHEQKVSFFVRLKNVSSVPSEVHLDIDQDAYDDDVDCERARQFADDNTEFVTDMAMDGIYQWKVSKPLHRNTPCLINWETVDPDNMSYEEMIALGEAVGTQRRRLSEATIASLPLLKYKAQEIHHENKQQCVICVLDYKEGDELCKLPCEHNFHVKCIQKWLRRNKACPFCKEEVPESKTT